MTLLHLVVAFVPITVVAVWKVRRDYRRHGRLTILGLVVLLIWFFIPHLALDLATDYAWPQTPVQFFGFAIALLGLVVCLAAVVSFRSARKVFCFDHGELTVSGLYRWSRNPQYVGWFLTLFGIAIAWWEWECAIALALLALTMHLLVLMEEEHLGRVFGDDYRQFRTGTPRYIGRPARSGA